MSSGAPVSADAESPQLFFDAPEASGPRPRPRPRLSAAKSTPAGLGQRQGGAGGGNGGVEVGESGEHGENGESGAGVRGPARHASQFAQTTAQLLRGGDGGAEDCVPGEAATRIGAKYAVAHDIFYAERAPDADISIMKIAKEVIGGVKQGADVTNVNLPATVLDPVSSLEKGMKSMQRGELIQLIVGEEDGLERFLALTRFYFSGLSKEKFGKKPYNPVLGEVFRCAFMHRGAGGETVLVAEQVSHHPPITAMHLYNKRLGFRMNSHAAPEPRFWGNSVEVKLKGFIRVELEKFGEEYESTRPYMFMSGFLAGKHRLEFVGPSTIRCAKSGYGADLEFKAKGLLGRGELNGVAGSIFELASKKVLYTLAGTWDGVITATHVESGQVKTLFDYEHIVREYSMVAILPPEEEREGSFSSVVWAECSKWIWQQDTLNANAAKRKVEDEQRRLRKERASSGVPWVTRYFEARRDGRNGYQLREPLRTQLGPVVVLDEEARSAVAVAQKLEGDVPPFGEEEDGGADSMKNSRRKLLGRKR